MRSIVLALSFIAAGPAPHSAQEAPPTIEVASVRPSNSASRVSSLRELPGGTFLAVNIPLRDLIRHAYALQQHQTVEGGPDWIDERFDVTVKAAGEVASSQRGVVGPWNRMVQQLLTERFRLAIHRETRQRTGYALVLARSDGRLGPNLRPSTVDCAVLRARDAVGEVPTPEGFSPCTIYGRDFRIRAGGHTMAEWASFLSTQMQAPVEDRTGLQGPFSIDTTFAPPILPRGFPALPPDGPPSLETALAEELGLRLERRQVPIEVLVIDRVERPTEK